MSAVHNVTLVQQCRSGKYGVDDDQRGLLLLLVLVGLDELVLVDVEHVRVELHLNEVSLGQGVALLSSKY